MGYFAVISNNYVENTIVCESLEIAEQATQRQCIEYTLETPVQIGYVYNESTNTFYNPNLAPTINIEEVPENNTEETDANL